MNVAVCGNGSVVADSVLDFELPFASKFLLLAAYVCSRNKPTLDRRLFEPGSRAGRRRGAMASDKQVWQSPSIALNTTRTESARIPIIVPSHVLHCTCCAVPCMQSSPHRSRALFLVFTPAKIGFKVGRYCPNKDAVRAARRLRMQLRRSCAGRTASPWSG